MARTLTVPAVQQAIEAFDLPAYKEALQALLPSAADEASKQAIERLLHTRRPFARPLTNRLPLTLLNYVGTGFRLIGAEDPLSSTQVAIRWITIFFLPVWPLGSYIVRETRAYEYAFIAEVPFDLRYRWAAVLVPAAIGLVLGVSALKGWLPPQ